MDVAIASDQERENLFAEIRQGDMVWDEIILGVDSGRFELTVFPSSDGDTIQAPLDEVLQALSEARAALEARGYHQSV